MTPKSLSSEFCIFQSDESRRQPILESLAVEVLASVEGLANEEAKIQKSQRPHGNLRRWIFPMILTNAELATCRFDPANVDIAGGTLNEQDVEIDTVPLIRFRKSMATRFPAGRFYDLDKANEARARTVMIVNSTALQEFLEGWSMEAWFGRQFEVDRQAEIPEARLNDSAQS